MPDTLETSCYPPGDDYATICGVGPDVPGPHSVGRGSLKRGSGMEVASVQLSPRMITGKKVSRLRRQGIVPVHVYGMDRDPQSLQVEAQVLRRLLPRVGTNVPVSVAVDGEDGESICFVREVQSHPVTDDIVHVDFMRVEASRRIQVEVPIVLEGVAPATHLMDGTLVQQLQVLVVEGLPMEIPESVTVDVSVLEDFEQSVHVSDLSVDPRVTIVSSLDEMVCRVLAPRLVEEEEVVKVAEEEIEEGVEAAEGAVPKEEAEAAQKAGR